MKFTEVKKINIKSEIELGEEKIHIKSVITLPQLETDESAKVIEKVRQLHQEIEDMNQTSMELNQ